MYNFKRSGRGATPDEVKRFEDYARQYFTEKRDQTDDVMRFAAHLHNKPPHTAKSYIIGIKEFLGYNGIEFTQRQLKAIRLKQPKGNSMTVEMDMDTATIRTIISHMDIKGRALSLTLASGGMRIGEALLLKLDEDGKPSKHSDVNLESNPPIITIRGKNNKGGINGLLSYPWKQKKLS